MAVQIRGEHGFGLGRASNLEQRRAEPVARRKGEGLRLIVAKLILELHRELEQWNRLGRLPFLAQQLGAKNSAGDTEELCRAVSAEVDGTGCRARRTLHPLEIHAR